MAMSIIRRLEMGEWQLYREVRLESLRESPGAFSSRYDEAVSRSDESWRTQADASAIGPDRAAFLMITDHPAGLAALYRSENTPEEGELLQMWIAPELRGGPAATALLEHVFRWAAMHRFSRIRAEVRRDNSRALRFYRKLGFTSQEGQSAAPDADAVLTRSVKPVMEGNA